MRWRCFVLAAVLLASAAPAPAGYTNFESSHVHPIALTPAGARLLVVNTPDALLEVFAVESDGRLRRESAIPVGLEPVSVTARSDREAWVVNHLSDSVSIVDLELRSTVRTLAVGDEPTDVAFAGGKAFVAISQLDRIEVFDLADLAATPDRIDLFSDEPRALAVSRDGARVYATALRSGNGTSAINANAIFRHGSGGLGLDPARLSALALNDQTCSSPPPLYPPLPAGIVRNTDLTDPPSGVPEVALIVRWNGRWEDDAGQDWSQCLPFRLPDQDLFVIDAATLAVTPVSGLGTSLFDISVQPGTGKIYVPNTDALNFVRFEHALGVRGHVVDNQLSVVDPGAGYAVTKIDLNDHIVRSSDPATNLAERLASISQPGMMAWRSDGSRAYLVAIGSRKLWAVDGACAQADCIFGPDREAPWAVEVGEGPTGVALLESRERAYVLNRFSNTVAVVDTQALARIAEVPLHDPSGATIKAGRRLLYDGVLSSGHGDAACSSCHLSGDMDGLAWDLGDPTGEFAPYSLADDNVRFIFPLGGQPQECAPALCASHQGFDPQKGPMTTQTLRGMLEPLHWRGDRPTMNAFNPAFVGLLGAEDIAPVGQKPAGLSPADMELFRQFSLAIAFPPNPYRNVDDTLPDADDVPIPGMPGYVGNPAEGERLFDTFASDAGQPCTSCHAHPFGAAGGRLGGVTAANPTSPDAAALFNGDSDLSPHSDVKVAHLRNIYEKLGPSFGPPAGPYPDARTGFGLIHDGTIPSLLQFLSASVFTLSDANGAKQVRDISSFVLHFPTGIKPCVGSQVTVPPGAAPTGTQDEEDLIADLLAIADLARPDRHGEVVVSALVGGRMRSFRYENGQWQGDVTGEPPISTAELRQMAEGPVSFLCAPIDSGVRLGGDRDEDGYPNGSDCASADPTRYLPPGGLARLFLVKGVPTALVWDPAAGEPGVLYEVVGGLLSGLRTLGPGPATGCVKGDLTLPAFGDARAEPPAGDAYYYQVRARNDCPGALGPGWEVAETLDCRGR